MNTKLNKVDESIWHIVGFLQQFLSPFIPSVDSELLERLLLSFPLCGVRTLNEG